jgi:hypothetical protein
MPHYSFKPYPLGNASQKLVVFYHGQTAASVNLCSFDGRFHANGSMRTFDEPQYWNAANGLRHLKSIFNGSDKQIRTNYADDPRLRKAYIADANYPQSGRILEAWNLETKRWDNPQNVRDAENKAFLEKRAVIAAAQTYSFWLSVPMCIEFGKNVTWKQFYTKIPSEGRALMDLIAQFQAWRTEYKNAKAQSVGQIYGKEGRIFDLNSRNIPKLGFLNTTTGIPYEHRTPANQTLRVIESYNKIVKSNQEFEEFISNVLA